MRVLSYLVLFSLLFGITYSLVLSTTIWNASHANWKALIDFNSKGEGVIEMFMIIGTTILSFFTLIAYLFSNAQAAILSKSSFSKKATRHIKILKLAGFIIFASLLFWTMTNLVLATPLVQYTQFNDSSSIKNISRYRTDNYFYFKLPKNLNVSSASVNLTGYKLNDYVLNLSQTSGSGDCGFGSSTSVWRGQSFIAERNRLDLVQLKIRRSSTSDLTANVTVSLQSTLGNATNDLVNDTEQITILGNTWKFFNFSLHYDLTVGSTYYLVWRQDPTDGNSSNVACSSGDVYTNGGYELSNDGGNTWSSDTYDTVFYLFYYSTEYPSNITIDVGNDSIIDYTNTTTFNSSEEISLNKTALNNYGSTCSADSNKMCVFPSRISSSTPGTYNLKDLSINLTLPITKLEPLNYQDTGSAWGSLTNNTYTNISFYAYLNITKAGVNNLTKTLFINLTKDIFTNNDYTLLEVQNSSNTNISSYSFKDGLLKYTLENVTNLSTHYNKIKVQQNNAVHYLYKSAVGGGYYYQITPSFTVYGTPSIYALINLPLSEQVSSNDYHPVYWVCLEPTGNFGCNAWSLSTSVTQDNNGNNSINGYPVNLNYYTASGKFTQLSFQANFSSPFLLQVVFSSGAATPSSVATTAPAPAGGGAGIGYSQELTQLINKTIMQQKKCPQGYYLNKDKNKCVPAKTKIEEWENALLKPRWTIGKWSFGIFSAGLFGVVLWALKSAMWS